MDNNLLWRSKAYSFGHFVCDLCGDAAHVQDTGSPFPLQGLLLVAAWDVHLNYSFAIIVHMVEPSEDKVYSNPRIDTFLFSRNHFHVGIGEEEVEVDWDVCSQILKKCFLLTFRKDSHSGRAQDVQGGFLVLVFGNVLGCEAQQWIDIITGFLRCFSQFRDTRFDLHDHWLAVLISHLPNVQQFMGITIMLGPTVHEYPGATAATVHHQAVVQVGVACICRIHICHPRQVPVEVIFLSDPAGVSLPSGEQQVEQSDEAEHQADEEELSEGWCHEPRKDLR